MTTRIEAAAKAAFESAWHGCSWNGMNPTTEETRKRYRREAEAALTATDAVMFSDEAVERAARRIRIFLDKNYPCGCGSEEHCPGNSYESTYLARSVIATLKGSGQ